MTLRNIAADLHLDADRLGAHAHHRQGLRVQVRRRQQHVVAGEEADVQARQSRVLVRGQQPRLAQRRAQGVGEGARQSRQRARGIGRPRSLIRHAGSRY